MYKSAMMLADFLKTYKTANKFRDFVGCFLIFI